jgi:hypothetical protein
MISFIFERNYLPKEFMLMSVKYIFKVGFAIDNIQCFKIRAEFLILHYGFLFLLCKDLEQPPVLSTKRTVSKDM